MRRELDKNIVLYCIIAFVATLVFCVLYCNGFPYRHRYMLLAFAFGQICGCGLTLIISGIINNHKYKKAMKFNQVEHREYTKLFDDPKKIEDADKQVKDLHKKANESIKKFDEAADEHSKLTDKKL